MNGYTNPSAVFASYNGHSSRSPERLQHKAKPKSSAKAIYGSDGMYFLRSSAKKKKGYFNLSMDQGDHSFFPQESKQRKHYTKTSINSLTDTSQYHVEHLTTFVLDRKDGMITIEDGIRKLRLLDAKGKVWTQDMLLQVEDKAVSLHDQETKNELENFPIGTIQHCQAVMNACSYDSILALVCKEPGQGKPDLHLFQCEDIKANLIHADIESAMVDAKGGKVKKRPEALKMILKSDGVIPPPPAAPAPEPPPSVSQVDVKGRVAAWSAWASEQQDYNEQRPYVEEGVCPEMTAARVDRDVQILNHILDDIEFFVTKLQKAAEAYNELSKRKKSKKGKKKSPGEGVLTLRSRPPVEEEFVDCLQKFKHAFNLLGKLREHIQNPSALDLVHFLFTPLRMVIQTSSVELARSVVVPLLSRETIDFLQSSLLAEEKHVWVTLGDGWTKCRLEWPKEQYFPQCTLRFRDAWEPPVLAYLGPSREQELSQIAETIAHAEIQRREEQPPAVQNFSSADGYAFTNTSYKPMTMLDQDLAVAAFKHAVSRHVDASYDAHNRGQPNTFAKSKYDFVARNNTELSVLKDEVVEVVDDRKQWWKVRNGAGASGYVPNNILEITRTTNMNAGGEPVYSHTIQQLLGELNEVKEPHKQTMKTDYIPSKPAATAMPPTAAHHHPMSHPMPHPMPPAPMPPPPAPAPARLPTPPLPPPAAEPPRPQAGGAASRHNAGAVPSDAGNVTMREQRASQRHVPVNRRKSNMEEVQDELMHRLTLGRSAQKKFQVPGPSGPSGPSGRGAVGPTSANVTYDSSPKEVRAWLETKGFSSVTITSLGVLTGAQLFSLNKEELKTVCPDDGARVFSQVTVQKAALEKSSGNELQEIMRRRQEKLAASAFDSGVESFDEGSSTH